MSKRNGQCTIGRAAILLAVLAVTSLASTASAAPASVTGCELLVGDDGVRVEITAQGEFEHRGFRVEDPPRYVVDIVGARHDLRAETLVGDTTYLKSVRSAQYADSPRSVTRFVLDLAQEIPVHIERTAGGLAVVVGGSDSANDTEARLQTTLSQPTVDPDRPAGLPSLVFEEASEFDVEAPGADHWTQQSGLGTLAEPQRREDDGSYARTMSINMQNADVRTILRAVADFSGRNIIAAPDVAGPVTVALTDVPWREALSVILRANGFGFVEEDGIIRVDTAERLRDEELAEKAAAQRSKELEPLVTKIVPIDYASAEELSGSVAKMLSARGAVEVDERTNALVVTDVAANVEELMVLARELDTRTPQVHIDAMIIDIDSTKGRELGVTWGATGIAPSELSLSGNAVVNRPITDAAGTLQVGTVQDWANIQVQLQSLERRNLANIISNPRITTTDNREASILVGQKIPLITQDVAGNPVTRLETIGIRLIVTPYINSDRQITLDIHPEVSDLSSQATVQGGVIINTSEADTRVLVGNRETAVIGGLIRNVSNDFEAGVPVLKDLPVLGALFRTTSTTTQQRELIVFLTPSIVDADTDRVNDHEGRLLDETNQLLQKNQAGIMR